MPTSPSYDDRRFAAARAQAGDQGWVLSRPQIYAFGITRSEVRGQVRARRWQLIGDQSVCLHNADIDDTGHWWAAIFQGGHRACLDGASSLVAGGLTRFDTGRIRVSVPRGVRVRRNPRYDIRQTRRWAEDDIVEGGIRRTTNAVAAVRGALWARTDREASYLVTLTVQQGLADAAVIGTELLRVRRDKRRALLHALVNDLLDGVRSLGELDVARELRRRGLPEPDRQVLRQDGKKRYYLDLYWDRWKVVVEIDGIHHAWAENIVGDALRQNALVIDGDTVLRLPLLGLRLCPDEFFDQIGEALRAAGAPIAA